MIRYAYDPQDVADKIAAIDATWVAKAAQRTHTLIARQRYDEASSIWSAVKPVFMVLQKSKCIFCERQFESPAYGKIEFDLEHFRPKSNVSVWPDPSRHAHLTYAATLGPATPSGYYWLAYELLNYAASCKVCNTTFKLNYFPVANARGAALSSPHDLHAEGALLCYPIGDLDVDPETLVTFVATTAVPVAQAGPDALRGQVIIDFFGLNQRDILHRERAQMIGIFGTALKAITDGTASAADHAVIGQLRAPHIPHAACVRAFERLWHTDEPTARRAYDLCRVYGFAEPGTAPPTL
jgi:hypothetical protein